MTTLRWASTKRGEQSSWKILRSNRTLALLSQRSRTRSGSSPRTVRLFEAATRSPVLARLPRWRVLERLHVAE
jgi:hypothetical protein